MTKLAIIVVAALVVIMGCTRQATGPESPRVESTVSQFEVNMLADSIQILREQLEVERKWREFFETRLMEVEADNAGMLDDVNNAMQDIYLKLNAIVSTILSIHPEISLAEEEENTH